MITRWREWGRAQLLSLGSSSKISITETGKTDCKTIKVEDGIPMGYDGEQLTGLAMVVLQILSMPCASIVGVVLKIVLQES